MSIQSDLLTFLSREDNIGREHHTGEIIRALGLPGPGLTRPVTPASAYSALRTLQHAGKVRRVRYGVWTVDVPSFNHRGRDEHNNPIWHVSMPGVEATRLDNSLTMQHAMGVFKRGDKSVEVGTAFGGGLSLVITICDDNISKRRYLVNLTPCITHFVDSEYTLVAEQISAKPKEPVS